MAHIFTITVSDEISAVIGRVGSAIAENGGSFEGSTENGVFSGRTPLGFIKGEYCCTAENKIKVTIVDKPFFVPYGLIELKIREYFS